MRRRGVRGGWTNRPPLSRVVTLCYDDTAPGRGAVWLARLVWDQEVIGSNPIAPTDETESGLVAVGLGSALARKGTPQNGHNRLEEAMAMLIQIQAAFVSRLAESDRLHAEFERRHLEFERETAERFARIEAKMAEIIRVLTEHGRLLERLTEAVREKIGFKGQP